MNDRDIPLILLSALHPQTLVLVARQLLEHLQSHPRLSLANIAYTLQVGREAMPHRLAVLADSREHLLEQLQVYGAAPELATAHLVSGHVQGILPVIWDLERARDATPQALAEAWVGGATLPWKALAGRGVNRVSLPGYPFERERHWAEAAPASTLPSESAEQVFAVVLDGDEFFLVDHQLNGRPILPGVMYLELISRALRAAGQPSIPFQLDDLVWLQPLWGNGKAIRLEVSLHAGAVQVRSHDDVGRPVVHCKARLGETAHSGARLDIAALQQQASRQVVGAQCYPELAAMGLAYGPGHQCLEQLWVGPSGVLARLQTPVTQHPPAQAFLIHPGVFDSALQAAVGFNLEHSGEGRAAVPFALAHFALSRTPTASLWAWLRPQVSARASDNVRWLDIDVCDDQGEPVALLRGLASRPAIRPDTVVPALSVPGVTPAASAASAAPDDVRHSALAYMREQFAGILRLNAQDLDEHAQLEQYGIDSIIIIRLTDELEKTFGRLSRTLFFEHQTLGEVTDYFLAHHRDALLPLIQHPAPVTVPVLEHPAPAPVSEGQGERPVVASAGVADADEIAIIGLAGRYPGASTMHEFWECLAQGQDLISEIPPERWDHQRFYDPAKNTIGKTYCKHGGFIDDVDKFDPLFFGISPREAIGMEPQERLFLECAYETLQDAGYTRASLPATPGGGKGKHVGVFVGVMYQEYQLFGAQATERGFPFAVPGHPASIANRVSYIFNLQGPSIALDTMCSSSITTLHLACRSIRDGECDMALAGGVNVSIHPNKYLMLGQGGFASAKGRCESFGEGGEGYVPGEGVGAVLLKRKSRAIADGDQIYGVIKASVLNHGGKTNGYTVPNPLAQAQLIGAALDQAGVPAQAVSYIEAHGTGTPLGDPIEIAGLTRAFARDTQDTQFCAIGSVKSNIGHCESAAGIAGISKVLLQLKHGQLAPSLHSTTLNPNIDFAASPFYVQRSLSPWQRPTRRGNGEAGVWPRLAGISSFGAGGANAHLLIEEYTPGYTPRQAWAGPLAIVLSAKTAHALQQSVQRLATALEDPLLSDADLPAIAFTLQVGREAMSERLALSVESLAQLRTRLQAYLAADLAGADVRLGTARSASTTAAVAPGELGAAIEAWVAGQDIDWQAAYTLPYPRKISLPTYPFARDRYWVEDEVAAAVAARGVPVAPSARTAALHPLVQHNISRIGAQRFSSRFDGSEFFFDEHRINGEKLLPAAASIEMFVAAARLSRAADSVGTALRLSRLAWLQPINLAGAERCLEIEVQAADVSGALQMRCVDPQSPGTLFCQATVDACEHQARQQNLEQLIAGCSQHLDGEHLYERYRSAGYGYGPAFQSIEALWRHEDYAVAKLHLPASRNDQWLQPFSLPPSLLDGALQASAGLLQADAAVDLAVALPFAINRLEIYGPCESTLWAIVRRQAAQSEAITQFNIDLCDRLGNVCVAIEGFSSLRLKAPPSTPAAPISGEQNVYLTPHWTPAPPARAPLAHDLGQVLVMGSNRADLARMVEGQPQVAWRQTPADSSVAQWVSELQARTFDHLVWLAPADCPAVFDHEAVMQAQETGVVTLFNLLKALQQLPQGRGALQLTVVQYETSGWGQQAVNFAQSGVHGLVGTIAKEAPRWQVRSVDIQRDSVAALADILQQPCDPLGLQRVRREGRWYIKQWLKTGFEQPAVQNYLHADGTYVVVGGAGGLGRAWSEYAIGQCNAQLVWLGRRPLDAEIQGQIDQCAQWGRAPVYYQADACDLTALQSCLQQVRQRFGELHGVIHSALSLDDSTLANMDEPTLRRVYFAKLQSSLNLGVALRDAPPKFLLFFSSTVVFTPPAGQANYSAGCLFQNALAQQLRLELKSQVKVIDWGFWGNTGVAASPRYREMMARNGIASIEPQDGMQALNRLFAHDLGELALLKVNERVSNPPQLIPSDEGVTVQAVSHAMVRHPLQHAVSAAVDAPSLPVTAQVSPSRQPDADQDARLRDAGLVYFKRLIAEELRIPIERLDIDEPLDSYGIDSIYSVRLVTVLNQSFADVSNTLFFEVQNIRALVAHFMASHRAELATLLGLQTPVASTAPAAPVADRIAVVDSIPQASAVTAGPVAGGPCDIAIVGLSGRYAQADSLEQFWDNLMQGRNCITEIPAKRWDWQQHFDARRGVWGKHYTKWGGFIRDIDAFDPLFFQISPTEAQRMDPQARLFLEQAHACIEDAGYTPDTLSVGNRVGVFVGAMNADYVNGASYWSIANRVSYVFDLKGPSLAVDTACSSSLSAIHLAVDSLLSGSCDTAIAGGVNLIMNPTHYMSLSLMGMLSQSDECRAFGADADGFVDGEGVGAVLLKPLSAAVAAGDHIYGVIKGSAMNAGGRTSGFTVPNPAAQAAVVGEALRRSGIAPRHISYIEAHGTGTPLGDPIEVKGLSDAFAGAGSERQFCALGSVKSNIGHCESAAGIAGLTKVLLQFQHATLLPSLHSENTNPRIDFARTPFRLQHRLEPWKRPLVQVDGQSRSIARSAGISSFGAGGANGHLIVQEYVAPASVERTAVGSAMLLLSAQSAEQLRQSAERLLAHLQGAGAQQDLEDIAYTLQVGRAAMEHRLAFGATSVAQARDRLEAFIGGRTAHEVDIYQGTVDEHRSAISVLQDDEDLHRTVEHWFAKGKLNRLLGLWVKGLHVDWQLLQGASGARRVSLPTYPFAREFYWLDLGAEVASLATGFAASQGVAPSLHPLLHENHSDLDTLRYTARFDASETIVRDHQVAGRPVLPAAAQVEMLRCAVTLAAGQAAGQVLPMRLRDLAWVTPVSVEQPLELSLQLQRGTGDSLQLRLGQGATIHCQGSADFGVSMPKVSVDLEPLRASHPHIQLLPGDLYQRVAEHGLAYGPSLRTLNWFGRQGDSVLIGLQADPQAYADPRYVIDPGVLDGALQALALFDAGNDGAPTPLALPFAVQSIELFAACRGTVWAHLRRQPAFNALGPKTDIDMYDQNGDLCMSIRGLVTRSAAVEVAAVEDDNALVILSPRWTLANL